MWATMTGAAQWVPSWEMLTDTDGVPRLVQSRPAAIHSLNRALSAMVGSLTRWNGPGGVEVTVSPGMSPGGHGRAQLGLNAQPMSSEQPPACRPTWNTDITASPAAAVSGPSPAACCALSFE